MRTFEVLAWVRELVQFHKFEAELKGLVLSLDTTEISSNAAVYMNNDAHRLG